MAPLRRRQNLANSMQRRHASQRTRTTVLQARSRNYEPVRSSASLVEEYQITLELGFTKNTLTEPATSSLVHVETKPQIDDAYVLSLN